MKNAVCFTLFLLAFNFLGNAQSNGRPHGHPHQNQRIFATTDDGQRVVLLPDGTWKLAPHQEPVRRRLTSEIKGSYLYLYDRGQQVDRVRVHYATAHDFNAGKLNGTVSFGNATYLFKGGEGTVRFMGKNIIGRTDRFDSAKNMAAHHFATEVYNRLTSEIQGSYLYVYEDGREIDKLRISYETWHDFNLSTRNGSVSFGNATYQYNGHDGGVRFQGNELVGHALGLDDYQRVAAWHFVMEQYGWRCG